MEEIKCINLNFEVVPNKITKVIFQTSLDSPEDYVRDYIKLYFPDYKYYHFKDTDIIRFIEMNPLEEFPDALKKFNSFKVGAHKADFFRYYFLYINGGIFLDSDAMLHCNIKKIIDGYKEVYIESNFFKDFNHIFNGFILLTYPKNPVIYEALCHMYKCDYITHYQMFCKELYKIIKKYNPDDIKIYKETIKNTEMRDESVIYDDNNEKILTHYFNNKVIMWGT